MKTDWSKIEEFRIQSVPGYGSPRGATYGMFIFAFGKKRVRVIAVDGQETGWEHVSVSVSVGPNQRTPNWEEMSWVKDMFWEEEECAIQFHPPKSEYVNNHAACLHLWKFTSGYFPLPPLILVGFKELNLA